jgi:hypothetical protein
MVGCRRVSPFRACGRTDADGGFSFGSRRDRLAADQLDAELSEASPKRRLHWFR